jgi:cob(I)alamin adenosyltransferase
MKIYTRTGDDGTTGLYGGARTRKDDPRVEAYGTVDETNAAIGLARAAHLPREVDEVLAKTQSTLFDVGSVLATPAEKQASVPTVDDADVLFLERAIDALEAGLPPLKTFVLPGGSEGAARLHVARTVCRRAERLVISMSDHVPVAPVIVRWLNRLSDLLFVQARFTNAAAKVADVPWFGRPKGPAAKPS